MEALAQDKNCLGRRLCIGDPLSWNPAEARAQDTSMEMRICCTLIENASTVMTWADALAYVVLGM
jgi:hypothetical protein